MQKTSEKNKKQIPWYKNHILLLIIFIPIFSVSISVVALVLAIKTTESDVIPGYYKEGLAPKQKAVLEKSHHISAQIQENVLSLSGTEDAVVILELEHPIKSKEDQRFEVYRNAMGLYPLPPTIQQLLGMQTWYLQLHDPQETWRIGGKANRENYAEKQPIHLNNKY